MKLVNIHIRKIILLVLLSNIGILNAQTWSLQQCIDTALVNNKNLQISRNNQQISEQKRKEVQANLIPKLDVNGEYKYFTDLPYQLMPLSTFNPQAPEGQFKEAQFGVPHNINANLQLSVPLYNAQLYSNIATTKIATEISSLQYKKTEEQVFFEVSNLYYNAQILQHQISFLDSNIRNTSALLKTMSLLKSQLLAKETDVTKIALQLQQLQTQRDLLKNKHQQVLNGLKIMIGLPLTSNIEIEQNIVFETKPDQTSTNNIDLQLAQTKSRLLSNELKSIKRSRLPSLALFGMYGTTGFGYDKQPNDFLNFYPIGFAGIKLQYPLFNGTVTQRKINQKKFEIDNADLQLALLNDQTTLQTENASSEKIISKQTVDNTLKQVQLAEDIYHKTILQQKQGTANLTEVLMAEYALREIQQQYLTAIVGYLKADLELKKLTGNFSVKQ
jgi:OMF family outer membrane factor